MSTHESTCCVCGTEVYCCNAEYALGCGGGCHDAAPKIDFCSLKCATDLQATLADRIATYNNIRAGLPDSTPLIPPPRARGNPEYVRDFMRALRPHIFPEETSHAPTPPLLPPQERHERNTGPHGHGT